MIYDTLTQDITTWFEQAVPEPSQTNFSVQMGVHIEEVVEMLDTFHIDDIYSDANRIKAISDLTELADWLKTASPEVHIDTPIGFLDALCDQTVTLAGLAYMKGYNFEGALQEVADSNRSKFDKDGEPIFLPGGKIGKGPSYSPPNLKPFLTTSS